MIPQIIHQTWKTNDIPDRFAAAQESWIRHHPGWQYVFWSDDGIEALVRESYPQFLDIFRSYPDQIQRVDAARYMILYKHGGFYVDLDIACERPLEPLCSAEVVLPATEPLGVSNDFMGAVVGSPFFGFVLSQLAPAKRRWPRGLVPRHFRVLLTTGSLFLTRCQRTWAEPGVLDILPARYYSVPGHPEAFVSHLHGSTWHQWDSHVFAFLFYKASRLASAFRKMFSAV